MKLTEHTCHFFLYSSRSVYHYDFSFTQSNRSQTHQSLSSPISDSAASLLFIQFGCTTLVEYACTFPRIPCCFSFSDSSDICSKCPNSQWPEYRYLLIPGITEKILSKLTKTDVVVLNISNENVTILPSGMPP